MSSYKKDMLSGLVFLVLGIAVLISVPLTISDPQVSSVGPRFFPTFLGGGMVIISVALLLQTMLKQRKAGLPLKLIEKKETSDPEAKKTARSNEVRALVSALIMLVYACLFDVIGFFASTFLCITALLALFKVRNVWSYVICYAVAAVIWAGFTFLLSVRLP